MSMPARSSLEALFRITANIEAHERRAAIFAFICNFILLGTYYVLRPLRDTMATVFGVGKLQNLFTATFVLIFLSAPLFSWFAAKVKLTRFFPGVFWFLLANLFIFYCLFRLMPQSRWVAAAYFCWFSSFNLILISVFWTLMADTFSAGQATRLYAFISAGGSLGAIFGPIITTLLAERIGVEGLLLVAIFGFSIVIILVHILMDEKKKLQAIDGDSQQTTLDHNLPGNPFRGFELLISSAYMMGQAAFILLMTWIATILYFLQTDLIARAYSALEQRTIAFADVDLFVNICSAIILIFGLNNVFRRFGVTASLVLSPIIMFIACATLIMVPTLFMVQTARAMQRISQYAIARPSREVLFTVVDQQSKYKAKNVIDTVVYRFGDLTAAWMQAAMRAGGLGFIGAVTLGVAVSAAWGFVGVGLGRRYQMITGKAIPAVAAI
jgi:AAA family ATP:ADP antiporter